MNLSRLKNGSVIGRNEKSNEENYKKLMKEDMKEKKLKVLKNTDTNADFSILFYLLTDFICVFYTVSIFRDLKNLFNFELFYYFHYFQLFLFLYF